jgi:hypothetical protein
MGERSTSMSEAAYSRFMTSCPVTAKVEKAVWSEDSYTGTFDNGQPLRGPSPVDMWSDPNPPPAAVAPHDWEAVRDGLHRKGKSLGGPKGSVGNLVFRASLALNLMQHRYKSDLFVVGGQGRLKLMEDGHCTSKEVVAACHKLRQYGNKTDHDEEDDLTPEEKPDVIKNVFIVAKALLNKVNPV